LTESKKWRITSVTTLADLQAELAGHPHPMYVETADDTTGKKWRLIHVLCGKFGTVWRPLLHPETPEPAPTPDVERGARSIAQGDSRTMSPLDDGRARGASGASPCNCEQVLALRDRLDSEVERNATLITRIEALIEASTRATPDVPPGVLELRTTAAHMLWLVLALESEGT